MGHTYCRHILAAIALAGDKQWPLLQLLVLAEEELQAHIDVCSDLKLICGDALLTCMSQGTSLDRHLLQGRHACPCTHLA